MFINPKLFPLLLALIFLAPIVRAQSLSEADVKNLLARIAERRASAPDVRADFEEQKTIRLLNKPIVSSGKIWFHAPNKFRREIGGNSPSVTVSNGRDLWIYYPNFKSAEHYSLGKRSPVDAVIAAINTALNLENAENTFRIIGAKIDNGYALQLLPRSPSMKRMFQKFDLRLNSDLVAERTEMTQANGDQIITTYSNQTRATIPVSTFEFTPRPGTAISTPLGR
ncbi:MAG TPA: outer membrane lipoprotein carrier protein LolA [Chthoniobacterales bacterium]|nr:outer membrane lipoprotein carrier protein LolA [Chthoniobacterales bacterium]